MENISAFFNLFWTLIFTLVTTVGGLLMLLWAFQKKRPQSVNFELIAKQLKINAYSGKRPYAAGVYKGRGILLQNGNGSKIPPVAVFCENPKKLHFTLKTRPIAQKWALKRWTKPGISGDVEFESLFSFEPADKAHDFLSPNVLKAAQKAAYGTLVGRIELRDRSISYIEGPNEFLVNIDQYLAALNFCIAFAEALEEGIAPRAKTGPLAFSQKQG